MRNDWWNNTESNSEEQRDPRAEQELFTELVNKALKGEHTKFNLLRCWSDRTQLKQYILGLKDVVKMFRNSVKKSAEVYVDQIAKDEQDLGLILALKQFTQCKDYYEQELFLAEDILKEYWYYIFGGHVLDTLIGSIRRDEDMVDYRTLPVKWF